MKYFILIITILFTGCNYEETRTTKVSADDGIKIEASKDSTVTVGDTSVNGTSSVVSDGTISGTDLGANFSINSPLVQESANFLIDGTTDLAKAILGDNYQAVETELKTTYTEVSTIVTAETEKIKTEFLTLFN